MTARTVRDVLAGLLRGFCQSEDEVEHYLAPILRDLRDVLTSGEVWRTREIEARLVCPGDVVVAKTGELWTVTATPTSDRGGIAPELVRAERVTRPEWRPDRLVRVLLAARDARALAVLTDELGAEIVDRAVSA